MDLHEALYTTRAMRRMKPDPIPYDVQSRILDAAIRAPHIDQGWRFLLVDDPGVKSQLAVLYRQAWKQLFDQFGMDIEMLKAMESAHGKAARSGDYLARHFEDVPLLLIGFSRHREGSGIYPALWSAMLAARAEGVGSAMTTILHTYYATEVATILGVPEDAGWHMHAVIPLGYPRGKWGVAQRSPVHDVAARNSWDGDLGFKAPEPLWAG